MHLLTDTTGSAQGSSGGLSVAGSRAPCSGKRLSNEAAILPVDHCAHGHHGRHHAAGRRAFLLRLQQRAIGLERRPEQLEQFERSEQLGGLERLVERVGRGICYQDWYQIHTWWDINTTAEQTGAVAYLRSSTPKEQYGCLELFNMNACDGGAH